MSWWDLGEGSGYQGGKLAAYQIACAFCGEKGNFETVQSIVREKPGNKRKTLNYDTLRCGHCGNFMFVFWSASSSSYGDNGIHDYRVLPWHRSTTTFPTHWPADVGNYWVEARRSIEGKNWTAAALIRPAGAVLSLSDLLPLNSIPAASTAVGVLYAASAS